MPSDAKEISPATLRMWMSKGEKLYIVDVRSEKEFNGPLGHIEGAERVPLSSVMLHPGMIKEKAKGKKLVVVCKVGHRSAAALKMLSALGMKDIYSLKGGMVAWANEK